MTATNFMEQIAIPCVLIRGGTSKGLYFHDKDIPPQGPGRDRFLKRAMGTPDATQIDGLGGATLMTSKVAIIQRSTRSDADVDYTFAQVDLERDAVGYDGNCGNISSGVGPFSIDEGLVKAIEPYTTVRIYNTNTQKILVAKVPVANGKARVLGDFAIAGVPGTGAEIVMDYSNTVGSKTGRLLPTGNAVDEIMLETGRSIEFTLCDAGNPCIFVAASDLGLTGCELPDAISANGHLIETIGEIQAKVLQALGFCNDWRKAVHLPGLPLFVMISAAADCITASGIQLAAESMDLRARLVFLGKCHLSMAGTGAICTAAASRVDGSVVNKALGVATKDLGATLRISHPLGVMDVKVVVDAANKAAEPRFEALGFSRTSRRLMEGLLYVPSDVIDHQKSKQDGESE